MGDKEKSPPMRFPRAVSRQRVLDAPNATKGLERAAETYGKMREEGTASSENELRGFHAGNQADPPRAAVTLHDAPPPFRMAPFTTASGTAAGSPGATPHCLGRGPPRKWATWARTAPPARSTTLFSTGGCSSHHSWQVMMPSPVSFYEHLKRQRPKKAPPWECIGCDHSPCTQ